MRYIVRGCILKCLCPSVHLCVCLHAVYLPVRLWVQTCLRVRTSRPPLSSLAHPSLPPSKPPSKAFLLSYDAGLRVVVHTANLLEGDVHYKTQGLYTQVCAHAPSARSTAEASSAWRASPPRASPAGCWMPHPSRLLTPRVPAPRAAHLMPPGLSPQRRGIAGRERV